ncbi:MAG: thiolase domain-containing protein [Nitrososphaerota archaeon]
MRDVAVVGIGMTKFGERWDKQLRDLFVEAANEALKDASMGKDEVQALFVGNFSAGSFVGQEHVAPLLADYLSLKSKPAFRIENACASSGMAFNLACMAIASGIYDIVMVGGVEKMTDISVSEATSVYAKAMDAEWESFFGLTLPAAFALIARRHMVQYGTKPEQLAMVSVKNHRNATKNPLAQFQFEITVERVLTSPIVSDPLHVLDCSPITDGAAAIVLCSAELAKKYTDTPVYVLGFGAASDSIALHDRPDITTFSATVKASRQAYKMAGIEPKNINVAELHDSFTIAEIISYEDLGFCEKGKGGLMIEEGETEIGGRIPVNPSGGLKARGNPIGATGAAQIVEIVQQLRGEAGKRQVSDAEIGMTQNIGGSGSTCVVHIFGRQRR